MQKMYDVFHNEKDEILNYKNTKSTGKSWCDIQSEVQNNGNMQRKGFSQKL